MKKDTKNLWQNLSSFVAALAVGFLVMVGVVAIAQAQKPFEIVQWETADASDAPESVYLDESSGVLYVTNLSGAPTEKNGKGGIYTLDQDGGVLNSSWFKGLDAPKGMRLVGSELLVADIDKVVAIDTKTAQKTWELQIEGAEFLNDIAVDADSGLIFVSDTIQSAIYVIENKKSSVFVKGPGFDHPNGLLVDDGELIVASWGKSLRDDWTVKSNGGIYALDLKTKKRRAITTKQIGNLDGLEKTKEGYLVSDWMNGGVKHISSSGKILQSWVFPKGSADIGYNAKTKTVFVPEMIENKITAFRL